MLGFVLLDNVEGKVIDKVAYAPLLAVTHHLSRLFPENIEQMREIERGHIIELPATSHAQPVKLRAKRQPHILMHV